jgi:hypothetical protein
MGPSHHFLRTRMKAHSSETIDMRPLVAISVLPPGRSFSDVAVESKAPSA